MALAYIHRQVRHQLGKVPVLAIRPRAHSTANMADHLFNAVFDTGPGLLGQLSGIGLGRAIHLFGAGPQHTRGAVQRTVDRAKVGEGMGLRALAALVTQDFRQALRRAVPARRDADPAVVDAVRLRTMAITCIAGLAGLPQVSLPVNTPEGDVLGVSLLGPAGSDLALIRLAGQLHAELR